MRGQCSADSAKVGLCWFILGPCWPILGLCWVVLWLCWSVVGVRLSHLGAMLARLEAMLAQHARKKRQKTNKKANKNKHAAKKPEPHATEGSPPGSPQGRRPFWGKVGPGMGAMLAHVGGLCRLCWAMLGQCGPYAAPSGCYVGPSETDVVQSWPDLGPTKDETQKLWKTHGFARFWQPCWGYVGA